MPGMTGPPPPLIASLVDGPSLVTRVEWHDRCTSTNALAAAAADAGTPQGLLVLAEEQTAGRGRHGRTWTAPPGTSLLLSLLLRPHVEQRSTSLVPLLAGLVLAETISRHLPDRTVSVKWPNDLLVDGHKAAGILAEAKGDAVVLGVGVNVDWRGVERPEEFADATSLAEMAEHDVDRWRVLAGFIGIFSQRYEYWQQLPSGFLDGYRQWCSTLGQQVRVHHLDGSQAEGEATAIADDGALLVRTASGATISVSEGDVEHLR
jgi:BirA family transcriptional regulator, biotin operon repressor / biotin---[acetyl-CoA-carboxylase] ligase